MSSFKTDYTVYLPSYSVGADCYKEIESVVKSYGTKAVVVGGKTAMEKSRDALIEGVKGTSIQIINFVWYGGNATYENVDQIRSCPAVQEADMVFAVGGGRAVDACKVVCDQMGKPIFTFPTIASNCAGITAISVMYNSDDSLNGYYFPRRSPLHCFINTKIIAESPEKLLWAGIGDAISKGYEAQLASRDQSLFHTPLMGAALSHACTEPLVSYGTKAMEDCRANRFSYELQEVALDIIITTGLVSNMVTGVNAEYYYNSSIAHCIYNGSTVVPSVIKNHLHGEIVSFGVLCLLTYDGQLEERDRLMKFYREMGLPITMEDIGLTENDLPALAEKGSTVTEWKCTPYPMNKETLIQKIMECDAAGKDFYKKGKNN